jgi:hypothetical protein
MDWKGGMSPKIQYEACGQIGISRLIVAQDHPLIPGRFRDHLPPSSSQFRILHEIQQRAAILGMQLMARNLDFVSDILRRSFDRGDVKIACIPGNAADLAGVGITSVPRDIASVVEVHDYPIPYPRIL